MENTQRTVWLDWMRVLACLMVMLVHCTEPYYLGGEGSRILTAADAWWAAFFDSLARDCVPLFVVASSWLLFPLKQSTGDFFRRRFVRVAVPFIIWSVVYALVWGKPVENLRDLIFNFNYAAGHLWFVYMLLGLYLIMPLLSPWAEKAGRRELGIYIGIWVFTSCIPIIRSWFGSYEATVVYGPSGIPNAAPCPLWGEASWNAFGTFYYISGFVGYLLLGHYFKKFVGDMDWKKTLTIALPCWIAGFAITAGGFLRRVYQCCDGLFPIEGPVSFAVVWETTWTFTSLGVLLMTVGSILIFRKFNFDGKAYRRVILPLSKASYGMYLCHMLVLSKFSSLFYGEFPTPVSILFAVFCTFVCVSAIAIILQRIPKIGKYIMG